MISKHRSEPIELKILRSLNTRMNLTTKEKQYYLNLAKGYEGEVMFNLLTENLHGDIIILNDLLLEHNNSLFSNRHINYYSRNSLPF